MDLGIVLKTINKGEKTMSSTDLALNAKSIPVFTNRYLNTQTQKIFKKGELIGKTYNEVAKILADVSIKEAYKDDGFKSAAEYAMKTFGFKKSFAYSLIKIGENFITPSLESNIPHSAGEDFTISQMDVLLPLLKQENVTINELAEKGVITPSMTKDEIKEVVKQYTPSKTKKEPDADEVVNDDAEDEETVVELVEHEVLAFNAKESVRRLSELLPESLTIHQFANEICSKIDKLEQMVQINIAKHEDVESEE